MPQTLPAGFKRASDLKPPSRLILTPVGCGGGGKSRLGLNAPAALRNGKSGVMVFNLDRPIEADLLDTVCGRDVIIKEYYCDMQTVTGLTAADAKKRGATELLNELRTDFLWGVKNCRSLVCDTGTARWDLINLSFLGKLPDFGSVEPQTRTKMNMAMKEFYTAVYQSDNNFVDLHEVTDVWIGGKPTDRVKRKGYGGIDYLTQMEVWLRKDLCTCKKIHPGPCTKISPDSNAYVCGCKPGCGQDGLFHATITRCKPNPDIEGMDIAADGETQINFATLGSLALPHTTEEDWA